MSQQCLLCSKDSQEGEYACPWCRTDIRRHLREIELYAEWLPIMAQPGRGAAQLRSPGFGSRPPVRLDVLVILDKRTKLDVSTADRPYDAVCDDDPDNAPRSLLVALESLSRMVMDERQEQHPTKPATIQREIGYLLSTVEWCSRQPWIDEHADCIRGWHRSLRALVGDRPPPPLAPCLLVGCDGAVFWCRDAQDPTDPTRTLDAARCVQCGRVYVGLDLVRLRIQEAG